MRLRLAADRGDRDRRVRRSWSALAALHRLAVIEVGPEAARWAVFVAGAVPDVAVVLGGLQRVAVPDGVGRRGLAARTGALGGGGGPRGAWVPRRAAPGVLCWCRWRCCGGRVARRRRAAAGRGLARAGPGRAGGVLRRTSRSIGEDAGAPFSAQDTWHRELAGPVGRRLRRGERAPGTARASSCTARRRRSTSSRPAATRSRSARHNLALFACLVARRPRAGRRAAAAAARAYGAYALVRAALPLSYPVGPQPLMSLPRFEAVLFPLFLWLGLVAGARAAWRRARGAGRVRASAWRLSQRALRDLALGRLRLAVRVLLDALGTLLRARAAGAAAASPSSRRGASRSREAEADAALRAEIAYYRAHHDEAATPPRWTICASAAPRVLAGALPARARDAPDLRGALLASLRFRAYPEVPAARLRALRARRRCGWSSSPTGTSRCTRRSRRPGSRRCVDGAISSAEAGAAKPDAGDLRAALALAGASRRPTRSTSATTWRPMSPVPARPGSRRCSSSATAPQAPGGVPTLSDLQALPSLLTTYPQDR